MVPTFPLPVESGPPFDAQDYARSPTYFCLVFTVSGLQPVDVGLSVVETRIPPRRFLGHAHWRLTNCVSTPLLTTTDWCPFSKVP